MNAASTQGDRAKAAITLHATNCVNALEMAAFAEGEGNAGLGISLRKVARFHAEDAWAWVPDLPRPDDGILRGNADLVPCGHASLGAPA